MYIEDEEGKDQAIQCKNYEKELFDYKTEVAPVLQVIVGKCLEQARIEVIEDWEE